MRELLSFPRTVNEKAPRTVAAVVAVAAVLALVTGWHWLLVPLAYGFWARVLTGPTLSPLAQFAMRVAAPRLGEPHVVSGPPKRFAQGIGAVMTTVGVVGWATGSAAVPVVVLAVMATFATLEAAFALCVGCKLFGVLMRLGVVPDDVCAECADIWSRPGMARPERAA